LSMDFSVTVHLSRREFIRMSVLRTYTSPVIRVLTFIGFAALIFGCLQIFDVVPRFSGVYPTLFIGFYFAIAFPIFNAWMAARNYRVSSYISRAVTYHFGLEGLSLDVAEGVLPWSAVVRVQTIGAFLLLYTDKVSAFVFPVNAFSGEQIDFVRSRVMPNLAP
jgi:hypothetical protein